MFSSHSWWSSIWQVTIGNFHMIWMSCQILDDVSFLHNISYSRCLLWTCCPEIETRFVSMSKSLCFFCCSSTTHSSNVKVFIALFFCASGSEMHTWTELNWALTQERPQAKFCIASKCDLYDVFTFTAHCHPLVKASLQRLSCSDVNNRKSLSKNEPTVVCKYFQNCLTVIPTCKLMARRKGRSLCFSGRPLY